MKIVLVLSILFTFEYCYTQSYFPFYPDNPARFENTITSESYYHYPTGSYYLNDTLNIYPYGIVIDEMNPSIPQICLSWGGEQLSDTTWLGTIISYDTTLQELILKNQFNELLSFNFGIGINDSSIIYIDGLDSYYLKYVNLNQENVLDSTDYVKTFTINKYDNSGNIVSSSLNNFEIKLSSKYGLVSFIDCFHFPTLETSLQLKGFVYDNGIANGFYQITEEEMRPWHIGDTIVYSGLIGNTNGSTQSYKFYSVIDRVETIDSVWIYFNIEEQVSSNSGPGGGSPPEPYNINIPNPLIYSKNKVVHSNPYGSTIGNTLTTVNDSSNCYVNGLSYTRQDITLYFCPEEFIFPSFDAYQTWLSTANYSEGVGITHSHSEQFGPGSIYSPYYNLVYSNIGGVQCGTPMTLGIESLSLEKGKNLIKITDLLGREVNNNKVNQVLIYIYSDGSIEKIFNVRD